MEQGCGHVSHHSPSAGVDASRARFWIKMGEHEQAVTASIAIEPLPGLRVRFDDVVGFMERVASYVEEHGGIVGHIKALAREGDVSAHASVVAAGMTERPDAGELVDFGEEADIQMVVIAFLLDCDMLLALCQKAVDEAVSVAG